MEVDRSIEVDQEPKPRKPGRNGGARRKPGRGEPPRGRNGHRTHELEELLLRYRPKLIYTNPTHHNPTGITLSIRTRRELLELAARYRVPIVEDDTYRELALHSMPVPPPSLFKLDESHTVVIRLNSFAKMLAPGLRLGWISAVRPIIDQLALIKQQVDPHTQNLAQLVVCELVEQGVLDTHLGHKHYIEFIGEKSETENQLIGLMTQLNEIHQQVHSKEA